MFQEFDNVRHATYGVGIVIEVEESFLPNRLVVVNFLAPPPGYRAGPRRVPADTLKTD